MTNVSELEAPSSPNGKEVFAPASRAEWRAWLSENADRAEGLWLVHRNKSSSLEGPLYDELVEEALCFGWIDSVVRRADLARRIQWFSPRRKGSIWSPLNKERIERLVALGLMTERGQRVIDAAIADGSWSQTDEADALIVADDLARAFDAAPAARDAYEALPDSQKKAHLWSVYGVKRDETRARRIEKLLEVLVSGDSGT